MPPVEELSERWTPVRRPSILENLFTELAYDCLKWLWATAHWRWLKGAEIVRRNRKEGLVAASWDDTLNGITRKTAGRKDWKAELAFQESLGRSDLSESELYAYLRNRGFGRPGFWERRKRQWISLEEAFTQARRGDLSPIEVAVNDVVWRVDNKWLGTWGIHSFRARTTDQRAPGYMIMRVIRRLYGLPEGEVIWLNHERLEGQHEEYNVRLHMPGVSSVKEELAVPHR